MIQTIGLIVAAYAMARLLQIPVEAAPALERGQRFVVIGLISIVGLVAIGLMTLLLVVGPSSRSPAMPVLPEITRDRH